MQASFRVADGRGGEVEVPAFMYGTAWKEDRTERLVRQALEVGFRAIDTANQRKHYHEAGVGAALRQAFADGLVRREDLFLQTKFTSRDGQDHRLPYAEDASYAEQVAQSAASSLEHLGVERLDGYVLHGPLTRDQITAGDLEIWRAMEALHDAGTVSLLGVSNVGHEQLVALCEQVRIQPAFVQNRCYARRGWDRAIRRECEARGIRYQGFSLLTANQTELADRRMQSLARRLGKTPAQVVFAFARATGMLPLTGSSDPVHLREDLAALEVELKPADVELVERLSWR